MNLLRRIFSRKPKPPMDRRGWSEDWQVGDVAVCVRDDWAPHYPFHPKVGDHLRVIALREVIATTGDKIISGLGFAGKPAGVFWENRGFQKIRPPVSCMNALIVRAERIAA